MMNPAGPIHSADPTQVDTVVIGAGIGGLAAAARLAHAGRAVTVFERADGPGGKMRVCPSAAGPVDAGPTVLTLRPVFETLFEDLGERLSDHVVLRPNPILARHYWSDGTTLDLAADPEVSRANVTAAFGTRAGTAFARFSDRARRLFDAFDGPMMQAAAPSQLALTTKVMRQPRLITDMAPHRTLAASLRSTFREPKLRQLFGRYATYVGGSPYGSPALLSLIWHAEAQGVWSVEGGMHALARALEAVARARGATFVYGATVERIEVVDSHARAVHVGGIRHPVRDVVFNGDPRALRTGALGADVTAAVADPGVTPRSLSADVHAFAATPDGPPLAAHTVFFGDDPEAEFAPLARGDRPEDATLYLCAQDRGGGATPPRVERFEMIRNAPPLPPGQVPDPDQEIAACRTTHHRASLDRLAHFGLRFSPEPTAETMTTPHGFAKLFPESLGSLYGRSPSGLMAALARPTARTPIKGLYLAGGGAHPGAGVPMATLSGGHAAAAILSDRTSPSTSRKRAMRGGMSTASATTAPARSRS